MASLREELAHTPVELSFGTSGLRGLASDMTDLECYVNTSGFIRFLQENDGLKDGETVYLAGDLRESTPRIMAAVHQAITDANLQTVNCGLIPTPAVAYYAMQHNAPCIMVTGSHIPADRNGIKFYKREGEVLKADEQHIKDAVAAVRAETYGQAIEQSPFNHEGSFEKSPTVPAVTDEVAQVYAQRYPAIFGSNALTGRKLVFYQHSAVGRDLLVRVLESLGAEVVPVDRSDIFIPIDSENITPENQTHFKRLAAENPGLFAIVSTDGDSDRPFVIDERGTFHRGDVLGAVVATWLQADFAAYPVSASDASDTYLNQHNIPLEHTKIGSPYVVVAMQGAQAKGSTRAVAWEVNGGFMIGNDFDVHGQTLDALPTRDAILPIIIALLAAQDANTTVSKLFATLPARYTQSGLINDFPADVSLAILEHFANDTPEVGAELEGFFTADKGFSKITHIDSLDGIRISFDNGDIAHLRPSGNAPQLRIYSITHSQERADEIVALAIAEPDGIFRQIEAVITA